MGGLILRFFTYNLIFYVSGTSCNRGSAVNMLVGFLSGYAGSHSSNNKCCDDLNDVKEAVKALQEDNVLLAAKVEILEEKMSHLTAELTTTSGPTTVTTEATTTEATTTEATTTEETDSFAEAEQICSDLTARSEGKLVSITSQELFDALVNFIRSQPQYETQPVSWWTSGRYNPIEGGNEITWGSSATTVGWQWISNSYDKYPLTASFYEYYSYNTHVLLYVAADPASNPGYWTQAEGFVNWPEWGNYYPQPALCSYS